MDILRFFLFVLLAFSFGACEGPMGPAGPTGPQGPQGIKVLRDLPDKVSPLKIDLPLLLTILTVIFLYKIVG